jgi:hemoglobin/transferrin/lactoferrin receptor protein
VSSGAFQGTGDGEGVLPAGKQVAALAPERLYNHELGVTLRGPGLHVRAAVFDAELHDPIVRRTLLFPVERVPSMLAGLPVVPVEPTDAQGREGVRSVATLLDPRSVKAFVNEGRMRFYGSDVRFRHDTGRWWQLDGGYSFLAGRELDPNRPVRRLPPQSADLALRLRSRGRISMIEVSGYAAGSQRRLSGGDLTDERMGAARRRTDIRDFFAATRVRPYLDPGADAVWGTPDDLFRPTGETVAQIRDRVLPLGATFHGVRVADDLTRVPFAAATPGFFTLNLRLSVALAEPLSLQLAVCNLLDRNYRVHGSGIDAPGVNAFLGLRLTF